MGRLTDERHRFRPRQSRNTDKQAGDRSIATRIIVQAGPSEGSSRGIVDQRRVEGPPHGQSQRPTVLDLKSQCRCWRTVPRHRSPLETDPGQVTLNFVLLYPTMRAAVENSAALTWLLSPEDRPERLERLIRVLRRDVGQFVANNKRLAASRNDSGRYP